MTPYRKAADSRIEPAWEHGRKQRRRYAYRAVLTVAGGGILLSFGGFLAAGAFSPELQVWAGVLAGVAATAFASLMLYRALNGSSDAERPATDHAAQLRDSEARIKAVIETAVDAVITIDSRGIVQSFNPAAERTFGYTAEECIGQNVSMLMPQPDRSQHDGYLGNYLKSGERKIIGIGREVVGRRKNGEKFPMDLSVGEFRIGEEVMFAGICRDVTQRVQAQAAEARMHAVINNAVDAVITIDAAGIIESFNPSAEKTFGYTAEECIGQNISMLMPQPDRGRHDGYVSSYLETGERKIIGIGREVVGRRKNGERFPMDLSVSEFNVHGKRMFAGICRDVTERRRAQDEIAAVNKELESFAYSVSHDLRAPLRGIDGFSQALVEDFGAGLPEDARQYLRRIRAGAQRMGQLIDDMLTLSRVTRGEIRREPVDLSGIAMEVAAGLQAANPDREVEFDCAPGLAAHGDDRQLRILLENLLGNAWKFTGKVNPSKVEIGVTTEGRDQVFFVRDNGAGFDMAYADKLFAPFQRLHSVDEFEGTGVGLATVGRIVQRQGGRIWAESAPDKGAVFYFTL